MARGWPKPKQYEKINLKNNHYPSTIYIYITYITMRIGLIQMCKTRLQTISAGGHHYLLPRRVSRVPDQWAPGASYGNCNFNGWDTTWSIVMLCYIYISIYSYYIYIWYIYIYVWYIYIHTHVYDIVFLQFWRHVESVSYIHTSWYVLPPRGF